MRLLSYENVVVVVGLVSLAKKASRAAEELAFGCFITRCYSGCGPAQPRNLVTHGWNCERNVSKALIIREQYFYFISLTVWVAAVPSLLLLFLPLLRFLLYKQQTHIPFRSPEIYNEVLCSQGRRLSAAMSSYRVCGYLVSFGWYMVEL